MCNLHILFSTPAAAWRRIWSQGYTPDSKTLYKITKLCKKVSWRSLSAKIPFKYVLKQFRILLKDIYCIYMSGDCVNRHSRRSETPSQRWGFARVVILAVCLKAHSQNLPHLYERKVKCIYTLHLAHQPEIWLAASLRRCQPRSMGFRRKGGNP